LSEQQAKVYAGLMDELWRHAEALKPQARPRGL
jgi:hypothetical protein